jgi:hypothetical protein
LVFIIIVLLFFTRTVERFDTYSNHYELAQKFRQNGTTPLQSDLLAKYAWNERDSSGTQIYDKVYNMELRDNNHIDMNNRSYSPEQQYLDSKFNTLNNESGSSGSLAQYSVKSMEEVDPLFTVFNGETITLSQKTY